MEGKLRRNYGIKPKKKIAPILLELPGILMEKCLWDNIGKAVAEMMYSGIAVWPSIEKIVDFRKFGEQLITDKTVIVSYRDVKTRIHEGPNWKKFNEEHSWI